MRKHEPPQDTTAPDEAATPSWNQPRRPMTANGMTPQEYLRLAKSIPPITLLHDAARIAGEMMDSGEAPLPEDLAFAEAILPIVAKAADTAVAARIVAPEKDMAEFIAPYLDAKTGQSKPVGMASMIYCIAAAIDDLVAERKAAS